MSKRLSENSSETSKKSRNFEIRNAVDLKVAVRPGFGTEGNRFRIKTNNFRILTLPKGNLYHYKFVISTPIKVKTHLAFKIFSYMGLQNYFGGTQVVFDGNSSIYSSQTLPIGNEDEEKIDVTLPAEGRMRSKNFMVIIQKVAQIDLQSVKDYMNGTCLFTSEVQTCLSVLNTILNYKPRNTYLIVKNGIFPENFDRPRYLGNGIELKQGYCQSIRPGIEQLIVNVDVCAACFYPACSLLQFVSMVLKKNIDNLRRGITDSEKRQLEYILKEVKIRVNHRGEHQPRFKIERLSSQATDYLMFRNEKEGRDVSVVDYFVQQYNRQLEFRCLPCVVVKKSNFIPIEVCEVLPGQKFEKSIDDKLKADIIKFTCIKPQERFRTIEKGIESFFKYKEDENLNDFGIQIDSRMIEIEARLLKPPIVAYDKKSQDPEFQPRFGRWNLMNKFFPSIRPLENWSILMLTRDPVQMVEKFARELMKTLNERGMPVNTFPKIIPENLQGDIEKGLVIAIDKAQVNKNIPVQIILVFIPRKASQPYGRIKQLSDTVLGIPTQCIVSDRLRKSGDKGLLSNLALKINAKLGGRNCSLRGDQLDSVTKVPTMIMGADISHPSVGANQPSIAAVCGSVEKTGMVYNGRYSINKEIRNETIENLEEMTTDLLRLFLERNKRKDGKGVLPQRIIFYRDGVSEGQFRSVLNREVMALKKAFEKVYSDKMPTLTFVIAQKRHHTRFVPTDPRANGDRNGNCQPGTCVDTEIVHKKEFDFYLQSHAGIQGTVRPTHYYVLYDENNFSADEFQSMTYRLCYLYARCTIATSIVPAIAYAHLLASRVRLYPVNRLDRGESNYDDDKNMSETSRYLENRSNNNFDYPQISQKLEKLMYFV